MQLPRNIAIGHGAIADTARMCIELKLGKRALVVTGRKTREIAGEAVADILSNDGFATDIAIVTNADQENIDSVVNAAENASFLVGVGGGTVIDVAKLASTMLDIPFLSVPTAAAHDGRHRRHLESSQTQRSSPVLRTGSLHPDAATSSRTTPRFSTGSLRTGFV